MGDDREDGNGRPEIGLAGWYFLVMLLVCYLARDGGVRDKTYLYMIYTVTAYWGVTFAVRCFRSRAPQRP